LPPRRPTGHVGHPEVVAERADQPHRLLERMLDLEAQAVEANDLDSAKKFRAHQQAATSGGMDHGDRSRTGRRPGATAGPDLYWMTTWRSP